MRCREEEVMPMFLDFYGLHQQPFGVTPDPAFLYPSLTHCEALDALTEGILEGRGFLTLIAEPGMGKTTLLYQVLEGLRGTARAAFLFQTQCNSREFFQYLLSELGVDSTGMGLVAMHNKLNEMLFAEMLAGKRFVLIVDEAQNLDDSVLETIRLLSNFETSHTKLLQIVLAGQSQLAEKLGQKRQAQLLQRIAVVKRLDALSPEETAGYIRHRLKVAGHRGEALFEPEALAFVAERSQGVPRNINKICFDALLEAHAHGRHTVSRDIVEKANRNLDVLAAVRLTPQPMPTPSASHRGTDSVEAVDVPATPELSYGPLAGFGVANWVIWASAFVVLLLSAALVRPRGLSSDTLKYSVSKASPEPNASHESQLSLTRELGLKINRIAIDPGHGGYDTGTIGPHGLLEKNLCLDVALRLGQLIEQDISGAEVIYTREDDRYVRLEDRTAIANRANADLFVSIHANSSDSREARGVETYSLSLAAPQESTELAARENALAQSSFHDLPELIKKITLNEMMAESRLLAVDIQNALSQRLQLVSPRETNRGVKQAPFIVLTDANMPAVLSEISFVNNPSDENLLLESGQRQRVAEGLYRGIAAFLDRLHSQPDKERKLVSKTPPSASSKIAASTAAIGSTSR
jgi:N-acetylmuramoyl-L-alanine amidase/type II secretory pathway predicted ATPase ExeA